MEASVSLDSHTTPEKHAQRPLRTSTLRPPLTGGFWGPDASKGPKRDPWPTSVVTPQRNHLASFQSPETKQGRGGEEVGASTAWGREIGFSFFFTFELVAFLLAGCECCGDSNLAWASFRLASRSLRIQAKSNGFFIATLKKAIIWVMTPFFKGHENSRYPATRPG